MTALRKTLIAAALGTALATPALAAPVEQLTNGDFSAGLGGWSASSHAGASGGGVTFGSFGQIIQTFVASVTGPYTISFDYSVASGGWLWGSVSQGNTYIGETPFLTGTGSFSVAIAGPMVAGTQYILTSAGRNASVDNLSLQVSPVPGPIAGAGLPIVLGLMGFAAWRRRQAA